MEATSIDALVAHCQSTRFTGILRMRAKEGIGEVWFLSGIADEVHFGVSAADEAMDRMRSATDAMYEIVVRLPHPSGGFKRSFPSKGSVASVTPVTLMRYCERYALTCTLEIESTDVLIEAKYELGELVSVETTADDDAITAMLEAKEGTYAFTLPRVELPAGTPVLPPSSPLSEPPPESLGFTALLEAKARAGRPMSDEAEVKRKTVEIARQQKAAAAPAKKPEPAAIAEKKEEPKPAPVTAEKKEVEKKEEPKPVVAVVAKKEEAKPVAVEKKEVEEKEEPKPIVATVAKKEEAKPVAVEKKEEAKPVTRSVPPRPATKPEDAEPKKVEAKVEPKVEAKVEPKKVEAKIEAKVEAKVEPRKVEAEPAPKAAPVKEEAAPEAPDARDKDDEESEPEPEKPAKRKRRAKKSAEPPPEPEPESEPKRSLAWLWVVLFVGAVAAYYFTYGR